MPGKVFVTYSHKDGEHRDRLLRFLRPLDRAGRLHVWSDAELRSGDAWRAEIDAALADASAAVLLVTQDFVDSRFITEVELPRLLAARDRGDIAVVPVFVSPAYLDFDEALSGLTDLQGVGTPRRTLARRPDAEVEELYVELARRLVEVAGVGRPAAPRRRAVVPAGIRAGRPALAVHLERSGDRLARTYYLPGGRRREGPATAWSEHESLLGDLVRALDDGDEAQVRAALLPGSPLSRDEALFRLLFEDRAGWDALTPELVGAGPGAPPPSPTRHAVRLRVCSDDRQLAGLPWRRTVWQGHLLTDTHSRWSFALADEPEPGVDVRTAAPSTVLVLAPECGPLRPAERELHEAALQELVTRAWSSSRPRDVLEVVRTRAGLEESWTAMRPHLLYVLARRVVRRGQPCLLLDAGAGEEPLPLAALAELFAEARYWPAALYLNVEGPVSPEVPEPGEVFGRDVPFVLWRRLPVRTRDHLSLPLSWLHHWLEEGRDPLSALHAVAREGDGETPDVMTVAVRAGYRTWRVDHDRRRRRRDPRLHLDRITPKRQAYGEVSELVQRSGRRVLALVAYGEAGNYLGSLTAQLTGYLETELAEEVAEPVRVEFPDDRTELEAGLEQALGLALRRTEEQTLGQALAGKAPRGAGGRGVLWLDWGVFGAGDQAALTPSQLDAWLGFACTRLAAECPAGLRLVSFAAVQVDSGDGRDRLRAALDRRAESVTVDAGPTARLFPLPAISRVPRQELIAFLEDRENTSCPLGRHVAAADRILDRTGGEFEPTVALIAQAEATSWHDLLGGVPDRPADDPEEEDAPFV